ncbi:helix-turn-helix transcriptional regulator [Phormidesmis sp. 146-35]
MLPQDVLRDFAAKYRLSDAELQVLPLALADESNAEIARKLGISDNAVRKRLSGIYLKAGISESGSGRGGPGRLADLQQFLESEYRSSKVKRVLVCWFGAEGQQIVKSLRETILSHPSLETQEWEAGSLVEHSQTPESQNILADVDYVLGCLTPADSTNSKTSFFAGYLFGRSSNFKFIQFCADLGSSLEKLPSVDGTKREELTNLLGNMISNVVQAEEWVYVYFRRLETAIESLKQSLNSTEQVSEEVVKRSEKLEREVKNKLRENSYLRKNSCFQSIISISIDSTHEQVSKIDEFYSIPAVLYPHYLIKLQRNKNYQAVVKALVIIRGQDSFWTDEIQSIIRETSHRDSIRVFAFKQAQDFDRLFEVLLQHGAIYNVYAMSYEKLIDNFREKRNNLNTDDFATDDFAIIESNGSKVVAKYNPYNDTNDTRKIRFYPNERKVKIYETVLDYILKKEAKVKLKSEKDFVSMTAGNLISMTDLHKNFFDLGKPVISTPKDPEEYFQQRRNQDEIWEMLQQKFRNYIFEV